MSSEIKKWREIKKLITGLRGKYGPQLSYKDAMEFHYSNKHCKNDYKETIINNDKYKKQSFKWKKVQGEAFDVINEESNILFLNKFSITRTMY
jgi:hypothetical protein